MTKEETPKSIHNVLMEEYYTKEDGIVYWNYRLNGGEWHKEISPHKKIPWITIDQPELPRIPREACFLH